MATKFVAPVTALVLLFIASSVGKPPGGKKLVFLAGKNRVSLCLQMKHRSPGHSNGSGSRAYALVFPLCHCRVPVVSHVSHAQCQTLKSKK